ncbi:Niban-like protein 1 [Liparis tanakae]|uniref:Niban-like protein 1 n=1 Tax=Liparis tanakae TaxID=230148 RepID=A0A4Z2DYX6_9TELE|nr:Niban-like protein 1 [Liparis tanakae]
MVAFAPLYQQQYSVALFHHVRLDIEGGGGPQAQLLHRKVPLENKSIFSGSLSQYLENKKWRSRFLLVPDSYTISLYDSKAALVEQHHQGLIEQHHHQGLVEQHHPQGMVEQHHQGLVEQHHPQGMVEQHHQGLVEQHHHQGLVEQHHQGLIEQHHHRV